MPDTTKPTSPVTAAGPWNRPRERDHHVCPSCVAEPMTLEEKTVLLLEVTRLLYEHSHPTDDTLEAVSRLAASLGVSAVLNVGWGEVHIEVQDERGTASRTILASPTRVDMRIIAATIRVIADVVEGRSGPSDAQAALAVIQRPFPIPLPLFVLASAGAAGSLATIFGADSPAILLASAGAGVGGLLRRMISLRNSNALLQPFVAAVFAGLVGAAASHFRLSRTLSFVAAGQCMALVPGPHFLNGLGDLLSLRIPLAICRLVFAVVIVLAISTGLLLGLGAGGTSLPVTEMTGSVPLLRDALAAAIATASFGTLFAIPGNVLVWTVGIAIAAHVTRWLMINDGCGGFGWESLVACALGGTLATLVARRHRVPFAALAFAAVVSMIPGIFMFRAASGMIEILHRQTTAPQILIAGTLADSVRAIVVVLAMGIGLVTPRRFLGAWEPQKYSLTGEVSGGRPDRPMPQS